MDENKLVMLPASLGDIPSLEVLTFNDNELDTLPPEIYNLDNLRWARCSSGWVFAVSHFFLKKKRIFGMDDNPLSKIPGK